MNLDKYTQKSQEALLAAQHLAQDYQHQLVEPIRVESGKERLEFTTNTGA